MRVACSRSLLLHFLETKAKGGAGGMESQSGATVTLQELFVKPRPEECRGPVPSSELEVQFVQLLRFRVSCGVVVPPSLRSPTLPSSPCHAPAPPLRLCTICISSYRLPTRTLQSVARESLDADRALCLCVSLCEFAPASEKIFESMLSFLKKKELTTVVSLEYNLPKISAQPGTTICYLVFLRHEEPPMGERGAGRRDSIISITCPVDAMLAAVEVWRDEARNGATLFSYPPDQHLQPVCGVHKNKKNIYEARPPVCLIRATAAVFVRNDRAWRPGGERHKRSDCPNQPVRVKRLHTHDR